MPNVSLNALLHISRSGMLAQQTGLDVTANNIANINTTGFKRSRAEFQELLNERLAEPEAGSTRQAGAIAGALMAADPHIFSQGVIEPTEYVWDMAIDGDGFFQVQMDDGTLAYTRDGNFRVDGEGRLVTANGHTFVPSITLPPDAEEVMVSTNGEVFVRRTGDVEPQIVANINLARVANPAGMDTIGQNLFVVSEASGPAQLGQPGENGFGLVLSYALEKSNVDLSNEVVDMISAQRAYSLMTRALKQTDDMLGLATQLR
jgi:flagellar basal-body rod protein FlgG